MSDFTDAYRDLLIKQYWDQPNARAEIELQASTWEAIRDVYNDFYTAFDLDTASGVQLEVLGAIVGLPRNRPEFDDDDEYRFFIRVKIAKNSGSAFIIGNENRNSLQDVIQFAFSSDATVIDRYNMALRLMIGPSVDLVRLGLLFELNLLPKPQGVRYGIIIRSTAGETFGFSDNPDAKGFASKFDPAYSGGVFARKVFL
jgi:hypothetical protein